MPCSIPCQKITPNIHPIIQPSPQAKVPQPTGWPSKFSKSSRCKHLRGRTNSTGFAMNFAPKKNIDTKKTCRNNRWMWSFHSLVPKIKQMYVTYICWTLQQKGRKSTLCFSAFFRQVVWGNSPEKPTSHRPKPASPEMDAELTVAVKPSHFLLKVNEAMAGTQVV